MTSENRSERVLLYLYGELDAAEREAFEADLERDDQLRQLLAREQRFDQLCPPGQPAPVGDEWLRESRLLLRAGLRQRGPRRSFEPWRYLRPLLAPAATGLAALLIGVVAGRSTSAPVAAAPGTDIVDLRVLDYDAASERVELDYRSVARRRLAGRLDDPQVRQVLAGALRVGVRDGDRLQAVALLEGQAERAEIRQVLIEALVRDENPGVRLKAVAALADMAARAEVRRALQQALLDDDNPGVRVAAIEALRAFDDETTLEVMARKRVTDDNSYIRGEAARLSRAIKTTNEEL